MSAALTKAENRIKASGGSAGNNKPFIKLTKGEEWIYGAEEIDVQEGSHWAVNPRSLMDGFVAWGAGKVEGERMQSVFLPEAIQASDLPDVGFAWKPQYSFELACVKGDDKGQEVLYKNTSKGAEKMFLKLMAEIHTQIDQDGLNVVPILELFSSSYKHSEFGKVVEPEYTIHKWAPMDAEEVPDEPEVEPEEDDEVEEAEVVKPKTRKRRRAVAQ
jgi:hypothetical protein